MSREQGQFDFLIHDPFDFLFHLHTLK